MTAPVTGATRPVRTSRASARRRGASSRKPGSEISVPQANGTNQAIPETGFESAAESPPSPTVTPPTTPAKPTIHQFLMSSLAAIFADQVTPPEEIYGPIETFDPQFEIKVGVIEDQRTRELFSLSRKINEMILQMDVPRNAGQVKKHRIACDELETASETVADLAWLAVKNLFPGHDEDEWVLKDGWIVAREKTEKDHMREHLERLGASDEEIESKLAKFTDDNDSGDLLRREMLLHQL